MFQLLLRLVTPHEKHHEVLQVLRSMVGPTVVAKNCRGCRVYCDAEDEDVVIYWVLWKEQADMDAYIRSDRFREMLPYIELSVEPPVAEVSSLKSLGGMEYIVKAIETEKMRQRYEG